MFDIGFGEMLLLAAIALIAIGPKQLPEVARAVGKLLGEIKKTMGEVTSTVASAREETDRAIRKVTDDLTSATRDIGQSIQNPPPIIQPQAEAQPLHSGATSPTASAPASARDPSIHDPITIVKLPDHPGDWSPPTDDLPAVETVKPTGKPPGEDKT